MSAPISKTRPRGLFVAVLLLLTLVLAAVITLQAHRTFLYHRATAAQDAAPTRGRYTARVGICQVDDYDITTEFEVR